MVQNNKPLLHLVFGGELVAIGGTEFRDPSKLDIVGIYPNYAAAVVAWRSKAQARSTTPTCATSWCICTASSTRPRRARPACRPEDARRPQDRRPRPSGHRGRGGARQRLPAHRPAHQRLRPGAAGLRRHDRLRTARDRGHVARPAFHGPLRLARQGARRRPDLPARGRRDQRRHPAAHGRRADPRLRGQGRRQDPHARRRGSPARDGALPRAGPHRLPHGGCPQGVAPCRPRHRDARPDDRPAHLPASPS